MLERFEQLRELLNRAPVHVRCRDCSRTAKWLTLPMYYRGGFLASPYYWCDKHGPWEDGISPKWPIHFDTIMAIKEKTGRRILHKRLREALGIKKGTRITEPFARRFFARLSRSQRS